MDNHSRPDADRESGVSKAFSRARRIRASFIVAIFIMVTVFVGVMNSFGLDVSSNLNIALGFAIAGLLLAGRWPIRVWGPLVCHDADPGPPSLLSTLVEAFLAGCYIFIAIVFRAGGTECNSHANTPFGDVDLRGLPNVQNSCRMQRAVFIISIIVA
jgi:hypothetical protein